MKAVLFIVDNTIFPFVSTIKFAFMINTAKRSYMNQKNTLLVCEWFF